MRTDPRNLLFYTFILAISTRASLDREKSETYSIIVKAKDLAVPQSERKSSSTTVLVKVLDDNDNYPQFSEKTYTIQLSEDFWSDNNVVAHITASDADLGNNAAIRYIVDFNIYFCLIIHITYSNSSILSKSG